VTIKQKKNVATMLEILNSLQTTTNPVICIENGRRTGKTLSLLLLCGKILNINQSFVFLCKNETQKEDCSATFASLFKNKENVSKYIECLFLTKTEFSQFTSPDNGDFDYLVIDDLDHSTFKVPKHNKYKKIIVSRLNCDFKVHGLELNDLGLV
jgi:hypothetical protein